MIRLPVQQHNYNMIKKRFPKVSFGWQSYDTNRINANISIHSERSEISVQPVSVQYNIVALDVQILLDVIIVTSYGIGKEKNNYYVVVDPIEWFVNSPRLDPSPEK